MINLIISAILWIITHLGISSSRLRPALVERLGEKGYLLVYSAIAFASLGYLVLSYSRLDVNSYLWAPSPSLHWVAFLLMPMAFVLLVGAFMAPNPTMSGQIHKLVGFDKGSGVMRITRHPFQWGVIIWAFVHVLASGKVDSLIFFGALGGVSLAGTVLMDQKKSVQPGTAWLPFSAATSNIPFLAIFRGKNRLYLNELWLPGIVGMSVYTLSFWCHEFFAGIALF